MIGINECSAEVRKANSVAEEKCMMVSVVSNAADKSLRCGVALMMDTAKRERKMKMSIISSTFGKEDISPMITERLSFNEAGLVENVTFVRNNMGIVGMVDIIRTQLENNGADFVVAELPQGIDYREVKASLSIVKQTAYSSDSVVIISECVGGNGIYPNSVLPQIPDLIIGVATNATGINEAKIIKNRYGHPDYDAYIGIGKDGVCSFFRYAYEADEKGCVAVKGIHFGEKIPSFGELTK